MYVNVCFHHVVINSKQLSCSGLEPIAFRHGGCSEATAFTARLTVQLSLKVTVKRFANVKKESR